MIYTIAYQRDCDCWRETAPLADLDAVNAKLAELLAWGVAALEVRGCE